MFNEINGYVSEYGWNTLEEIAQLEADEMAVIAEEEATQTHNNNKAKREARIQSKKSHKTKDRFKTKNFQKIADSYKRTCKKKGYALKYKGQTQKAHAIVPNDSLGWHRFGMSAMGTPISGVKLGYIFDVT